MQYLARPHQLLALESKKKLVFMGCGIGAGKTDTGSLYTVQRVAETPPGVIGLIAANTYAQLYDATLRNFYKNIERFGLSERISPSHLSNSYGPTKIRIHNGRDWVEILCRSLDHYTTLSGIEIGWFWMDEVFQTKREAFDVVMGRMRDIRMENRGLLTTTLDDPTSWMHEVFVDNYDEAEMEVIYAPTHANAPNLRPGYIESLKKMYSPQLYRRNVLAKWVPLETGLIYYNFNRGVHMRQDADFVPGLPVYWSLDFNIGQDKPMSSALGQQKRIYRKGKGYQVEFHWFDEIILDSADTNDAATECKARLKDRGVRPQDVRVYGDASGKHGDSRSKKTDYSILQDHGFTQQYVPNANPPLRDRHNAVNSMLRNADGEVRMFFHPRMKTTAKGMETVKIKKGAQYLEEESREQHVTTAVGYLTHKEYPLIQPNYVKVVETKMGGR